MRYNQHVLTRFEFVYMGEIEFITSAGPTFRGKFGNYTPKRSGLVTEKFTGY